MGVNNLDLKLIERAISLLSDSPEILRGRKTGLAVNALGDAQSIEDFPMLLLFSNITQSSGGNMFAKFYDAPNPASVNYLTQNPIISRVASNNVANIVGQVVPIIFTQGCQIRMTTGGAYNNNGIPASGAVIEYTYIML